MKWWAFDFSTLSQDFEEFVLMQTHHIICLVSAKNLHRKKSKNTRNPAKRALELSQVLLSSTWHSWWNAETTQWWNFSTRSEVKRHVNKQMLRGSESFAQSCCFCCYFRLSTFFHGKNLVDCSRQLMAVPTVCGNSLAMRKEHKKCQWYSACIGRGECVLIRVSNVMWKLPEAR